MMTKGGFYRGGPVLSSAVAGIDQALWDIAGKRLGVPVHVLLGGPVRDRVRVYGWIGGDDPARSPTPCRRRSQAGLTAVKMNASGAARPPADRRRRPPRRLDRAAAAARGARPGPGPRDRLPRPRLRARGPPAAAAARAVPSAVRRGTGAARQQPRCAGPPRRRVQHARSRPASGCTRAGTSCPCCRPASASSSPTSRTPAASREVRRIAALAETFDAALAPHCPLGPLALAACLQLDFATPNLLIQEQSLGIHYNRGGDLLDYLVDPSVFAFHDGYVERTRRARPGCRHRRGRGAGGGRDVPPVAHAGLAARDGAFAEW